MASEGSIGTYSSRSSHWKQERAPQACWLKRYPHWQHQVRGAAEESLEILNSTTATAAAKLSKAERKTAAIENCRTFIALLIEILHAPKKGANT
jgi:hypothetical protein